MTPFTNNVSSRPRVLTATLTVLGVLTAATALVSPAIGANEPSADGMQTNVYYTQVDLATAQGTRALYRRLERAAEEVCPVSSSLLPGAAAASQECQRQAIARAIGEIGSSRLAAIDAQTAAKRG
ncbi:MAG: UrcA family protein [Steroidobacteraceae bacterium]